MLVLKHRTAGWFPRRAVTPFWLHQHLITAFLCSVFFPCDLFSERFFPPFSLFLIVFIFFYWLIYYPHPPGNSRFHKRDFKHQRGQQPPRKTVLPVCRLWFSSGFLGSSWCSCCCFMLLLSCCQRPRVWSALDRRHGFKGASWRAVWCCWFLTCWRHQCVEGTSCCCGPVMADSCGIGCHKSSGCTLAVTESAEQCSLCASVHSLLLWHRELGDANRPHDDSHILKISQPDFCYQCGAR